MIDFDMSADHISAQDAAGILKDFFLQTDAQRIFISDDPRYYRRIRKNIRDIFFRLTVWERPYLESTRGLNWPYESLNKRKAFFSEAAHHPESDRRDHGPNTEFIRTQALLFLAFLPFSAQWQQLLNLEREGKNNPLIRSEIQDFLQKEQEKCAAKLRKKAQKTFRLRHFCQILKAPRMPKEKGILRIFSLPYLFADMHLLLRLSRRYFLYVEPPWGVLARHSWLRCFSVLEDPVLFGVCGQEDANFLKQQSRILCTPLAHGDYLEEDGSIDRKKNKEYDIVFNATFDDMPRKRHRLMLELLQHPLLENRTALFIGRGSPENAEKCRKMVLESGLEKRVTVKDNLLRKEVPSFLAKCRMGVQLSLHENGCRSIYEYFRSDLPCVVSSCTAGMNFSHFTPRTGFAVPDIELAKSISGVLADTGPFAPRAWFFANSGTRHSTEILNRRCREIFENRGYEWTSDIVPLGSSGANRYICPEHYEQFLPQFEELLKIFREAGVGVPLCVE